MMQTPFLISNLNPDAFRTSLKLLSIALAAPLEVHELTFRLSYESESLHNCLLVRHTAFAFLSQRWLHLPTHGITSYGIEL